MASDSASRELTRYAEWFAPTPSTVVLQPTTLCNLDCSYCYLPFRRSRNEMSIEVASAVAEATRAWGEPDHPVGVVWHGGEPLAAGLGKFVALLDTFEPARRAGMIQHYVQTNATLITDEWCETFDAYEVRIGVSIDGPAALNALRVDWNGKPAFDRIFRGIGRLRSHGIPFSLICVIGTESIDRHQELLDFLADLGAHTIGLNLEEVEGVNTRRPPTPVQAETFWRHTIDWVRSRSTGPEIRDLERLAEYLGLIRAGGRDDWEARRLDPIPTISAAGEVVLLSPELADTTAPAYGDFVAGNVLTTPLVEIIQNAPHLGYVRDFLTGLERCRAECEFFDFCRGAQAANRYFENGSLATTETNYCKISRQSLVTALAHAAGTPTEDPP